MPEKKEAEKDNLKSSTKKDKSEKEIRFITQREYPYSKPPKGIPIKIDLKELCEKIIIAPGSKQCMIKKIKNKLKKYCADDIEIAQSSLDTRPKRV